MKKILALLFLCASAAVAQDWSQEKNQQSVEKNSLTLGLTSIFDEGVLLDPQPGLNFIGASVTCSSNTLTQSVDCSFDAGSAAFINLQAGSPGVADVGHGHITGDWEVDTSNNINGLRMRPQVYTADHTLGATESEVECDATAGNINFTLATAAGVGRAYSMRKIDATANTCTMTRVNSNTIEGATSVVLTRQWGRIGLISYASGFWGIFQDTRDNTIGPERMKMSATQRLVGRNTAAAGAGEEVTATQALDWIGSTRGSLLYRGASNWGAITPSIKGQVLSDAGTGADPLFDEPGCGGAMGNRYCWFEDFTGVDGATNASNNGMYSTASEITTVSGTHGETSTRNSAAGQCAGVTTVQDSNHPGVNNACTGTSTTGAYGMRWSGSSAATSSYDISADGWGYETLVYPMVLSNGTDTYVVRWGFGDSAVTSTNSTGAWAAYTDSVNSGKLVLHTRDNGGTDTSTNGTCSAVAAGAWMKIKLYRTGGHWNLYQDGALCATSASGEPTAGHFTGWGNVIVKSAGTTAVTWAYDYVKIWGVVTR